MALSTLPGRIALLRETLKCSCQPARPALSTGDVLLEEFRAIHGRDLKQEYDESGKEASSWLHFPEKEYDEKRGNGSWNALSPEEKEKEKEKERDKARQRFYFEQVYRLKAQDKAPGQTALCLSGGGIRSAAFALGVMQGLARHGLLSQFHYLSTVSGGGYAGAWLTAWATRAAERTPPMTFKDIEDELGKPGHMPAPLSELRKYQAFLTPKTGISSPDTWAAIAHVIRNMLLNWLVFAPLLASVLLIPQIIQSLLLWWRYSTDKGGSILDALWHSSASFAGSRDPHTWLDGLGVIVIMFGIGNSMVMRSGPGVTDAVFARWVLTPVIIGIFFLVAQAPFWLPQGSEPALQMLFEWMVLTAAAFAVIRLFAFLSVRVTRRGRAAPKADTEPGFWTLMGELSAQMAAGAVVGLMAWFGVWLRFLISEHLDPDISKYDAVFGVPWLLMAFLMGQVLLAGLSSRLVTTSSDRNREWWARASGWFGAAALGWVGISGLVIFGLHGLKFATAEILTFVTAGSGVLSLLGASPISGALGHTLKGGQLSLARVITFASVIFIFCLSVWIAAATTILLDRVSWEAKGHLHDLPWLGPPLESHLKSWFGNLQEISLDQPLARVTGENLRDLAFQRLAWTGILALVLFLASLGASWFVNVNYFSLNAMYRNRLIRAFLGASNIPEVTIRRAARDPFDGIAVDDNLSMNQLKPPRAPESRRPHQSPGALEQQQPKRLFPVINMTLNVTATDNKAWQERKADSFISTPLHTGGNLVGYRSSEKYAGGITLGTTMSLSGAAVSPNWGYHTSSLASFIMAIFNVRLGQWLGNPRLPNWTMDGPKSGWRLFLQEALGRTSADQPFVYLSDGGHFENLGLYEMVRRRCQTIVVSDAGADPTCTLEDLGNSIRKISIDLGVTIEFERIDMRKRGPDPANPGVYCAIGRVIYPDLSASEKAKEGRIVYIKPGFYDDAPADVRAYAAANAKFPHDTTLNQWFTESQFESYRALGAHTIAMITGERDPSGNLLRPQPPSRPIEDLFDFSVRAEEYLKGYRDRGRPQTQMRAAS